MPTLAFSAVNPGGDVLLTDEPRTYVYLARHVRCWGCSRRLAAAGGCPELAAREPAGDERRADLAPAAGADG